MLVNTAMLALYLAVMLHRSALLALVGLGTVVLNAAVARCISNRRVNISRSMTMDSGKLHAATVSGVEMIETIKAAGAENGYFGRWAGYQASVNNGQARLAFINERLGAVPLMLTELANITVLVLGVWLIVQQQFTAGALLAFQGYLAAFMGPVGQLINLGQTMQEMQVQMERVEDVLKYPADVPLEEETVQRTVSRAEGRNLISPPYKLPDLFPEHAQRGQEQMAGSRVSDWASDHGREKLRGQVDLDGLNQRGESSFQSPHGVADSLANSTTSRIVARPARRPATGSAYAALTPAC